VGRGTLILHLCAEKTLRDRHSHKIRFTMLHTIKVSSLRKQKRHSVSMSKVGVGLLSHLFRRIQYFEISERFQEVEFEHRRVEGRRVEYIDRH
jgi:hypothetical protein